MNDEQVKADL